MMVVTDISTGQMVTLFVTVLVPLLIGLLTKASWSASLKAMLLAGMSALIGVAQGLLAAPTDTVWSWQVAVVNGVIAWVIAVATYFGLWKPTGAAAVAQATLVRDDPVPEDELPAAA